MVNERTYYDTEYSYIKPVRHFKANDPYYFEVDNIPIKQLEENTNFLKDQVDGLLTKTDEGEEIEIGRDGFSELKPFVTGEDRIVRVKPGRYTSRINNAYDITPLQVVEQIAGFDNAVASGDINTWQVKTNRAAYTSGVLEEFAQGLTGTPYNMNGLAERAFVWPIDDEDGTSLGQYDLLNISSTTAYSDLDSALDPDDRPLWPNVIGAILKHTTVDNDRDLTLLKNVFGGTAYGGQQGRLESEFIKRFRGVTRTAIVDVPEQLEIEVEAFDENDFFIIDEQGNSQSIDATQRIDLLFIYSKAVDEESTTIAKFGTSQTPESLTSPRLGIVKGAGLGFSKQLAPDNSNPDDRVNLQSLEGKPLMLAHPGDEGGNNGFTTSAGTIKGSFPSPDDLLNLAPVISENLEVTSWPLIGQTILPIAYIRVRDGQVGLPDILTQDDIMDIRPFFRTTELAYNERAGIAAATPQISIANPVVSEAHLEKVRTEIYNDLFQRIGNNTGSSNNASSPPVTGNSRLLAAGQILGGFNHGPEGALSRQKQLVGESFEELKTKVELEFGFPEGRIPFGCEWDKAKWWAPNFSDDQVCDHINVADSQLARHGNTDADVMPPYNGAAPPAFANQTTGNFEGNLGSIGHGKGFRNYFARSTPTQGTIHRHGEHFYNISKQNNMYFVSKKIFLNNNPYDDYKVNVQFLNCIPIVQSVGAKGAYDVPSYTAQPAGIFVIKHSRFFIINVAFVNDGLWPNYGFDGAINTDLHQYGDSGKPWKTRNDARRFSAFMLPDFDMGGSVDSDFQTIPTTLQDEPVNGFGVAATTQSMLNHLRQSESNPRTEVTFLNSITPILYPSVSFEVIGVDNALSSNIDLSSRLGGSVINL